MRNLTYLLFVSTLLYLSSCTEKIDFELNNEEFTRIVVEGLITDQTKSHLVKLSFTSSYYEDQEPEMVTGAVVTITDGSNVWPLNEEPSGSGYYYTENNVSGTVGEEHTLTIEYNGETLTGSDYMNPVAELQMIELEKVEEDLDPEEDPFYLILAWTQETPGPGDYYRWRVYQNGITAEDSLENYAFGDDALYDGALLEGFELWDLGSDVEIGDTITLEQMSITEQANDIFIAMNLETFWRGGLFDSAPANVQTNMSNGAIGFFGASSVSAQTVIVEE